MEEYTVFFLIALLNLDTTSFMQISISRASFVGFLCGYILGIPLEGLLVGLLIEFVMLDLPPIGGIPVPNECIASGVGVVLSKKIPFEISFFMGLVAGIVYSYVDGFVRKKRVIFNGLVEKDIERHRYNLGRWIFISILIEFVIVFIYTFVLVNLFDHLYFSVSFLQSEFIHRWFRLSVISTVFVVLTSFFFKFFNQVRKNA